MQGFRYTKTGAPIQVGGMSSGKTVTATEHAVSGVIEIQDVSGSGGWIAFGVSGVSAPDADADNAYYIPANGITRPFAVNPEYTHVISSTGFKINIRSLEV